MKLGMMMTVELELISSKRLLFDIMWLDVLSKGFSQGREWPVGDPSSSEMGAKNC